MINVNGIDVTFDVERWITSKRLAGQQPVVGNEIFACCPFHDDTKPSWSVNVETGGHHCFSCGAGGSLVSLVKRLDGHDTMWDAEQWLQERFGVYTDTTLGETLTLDFAEPAPVYTGIPEMVLDPFRFRSPYLATRGIADAWQRVFDVGYDRSAHAITIPWRFADGTLATIKKRSVASKQFWYDPSVPAGAKRRLLWGVDKIAGNTSIVRAVAITESETDALYIYQCLWQRFGVAAVAIGGAQPSTDQLALVQRYVPPSTEIIVMTDNDNAGRDAAAVLTAELASTFKTSAIDWGGQSGLDGFKDVNDMPAETLVDAYKKRKDAVGITVFTAVSNEI